MLGVVIKVSFLMSKEYTRAQKLAYQRKMRRMLASKTENHEISQEEYAFVKAEPFKKDNEGKWKSRVHWEDGEVDPVCLFGREDYINKHWPEYQGKSTDFIREDLLLKQAENDGTLATFEQEIEKLTPKEITEELDDEYEKNEEELTQERESFQSARLKPR